MVGTQKENLCLDRHPPIPTQKMSLPKFIFSHLIGHMQILFLKLVVTISGWN
jgi:hypothetical protein